MFLLPSLAKCVKTNRRRNIKKQTTKRLQLQKQSKVVTKSTLGSSLRFYSTDNTSEGILDLITKCSRGDLDAVKTLLSKEKASVNAQDYDKRSPLHLAAREGHLHVCKFLLEKGADLNSLDRWSNTPLSEALEGRHDPIIKYLRAQGGIVSTKDPSIAAKVSSAASSGDLEMIQRLLNSGVDVNNPDYDKRTPLHVAVVEGNVDIVKALVENNADVNVVDRFGNTPLVYARQRQHDELVKYLIDRGATQEHDIYQFRHTPEFKSSLQQSLPLICERGGFEYAEAWVPTADRKSLECPYWFSEKRYREQFSNIHSLPVTLTKSKTAIGKAWETKQIRGFTNMNAEESTIEYLEDEKRGKKHPLGSLDLGARERTFAEIGMKGGMILPLFDGDKVFAVILLLSSEIKYPKLLEESKTREIFFIYVNGLINAGVYRTSEEPYFSEVPNISKAKISYIYKRLVDESVFSASIVYHELDWFINLGLQRYYWSRFPAEVIATHVHSFIAAKKLASTTGDPEAFWQQHIDPTGSPAFFICPFDNDNIIKVERKIVRLINNVVTSVDDPAYNLTFFKSEQPATPNGNKQLCIYIFDRTEYAEPASKTSGETDLNRIATKRFLKDKSESVIKRYQDLIRRASKKLAPIIESYEIYKDGSIPVMFAVKQGKHLGGKQRGKALGAPFLTQLTEMLKAQNLQCKRKFIETFSNGIVVYSMYLDPCERSQVTELETLISLLHLIPESPLTSGFISGNISTKEYAYGYAAGLFAHYFCIKPSEEFREISEALKADAENLSRLQAIQTRYSRGAISMGAIHHCLLRYADVLKILFTDFIRIGSSSRDTEKVTREIRKLIQVNVIGETEQRVFESFLTFNNHVVKHNFNTTRKAALAFRLKPKFLDDLGQYPETPFGVFLVMTSQFHGFHVRFRDVSRGGIRVIRSGDRHSYNTNLQTLFTENYRLAFTQNKKNKDIPEFGSKGVILMNYDTHSADTELAFQKYCSGLLDLCLKKHIGIVDIYKQEEILYLGPDEGTADFTEWACTYAKKRGSAYWKAFATGKSPSLGGIPHDTYGMTTRSVRRYVMGCMNKLHLDEAQVTKFQTGGPDGDLGSNEILMSKEKTIAVVDGSGVAYDPQGLDRDELVRLTKEKSLESRMIKNFERNKLREGGFIVQTTDRDVMLPDGDFVESGLTFRNTFHLNPLSTADIFVPCGGRPDSINRTNVKKMFFKDGSPRFKIIVEGANLFISQDARLSLERSGVVLYKDASGNKGGVTSSSLEVFASLAFNNQEFEEHMQMKANGDLPQFYQDYVLEIEKIIAENADLEFECVWKEHERTGTPRAVITDLLSDKINRINDDIQDSSLWMDNVLARKVLETAIPRTLQKCVGLDTIIKRVPESYIKAVFGAHLASRYVYNTGLSVRELAFFEYIKGRFSFEKSDIDPK